MIVEISQHDDKTKLVVTHFGFVPDLEWFEACSKGWTYYLNYSLLPLITTGKGNPDPELKNDAMNTIGYFEIQSSDPKREIDFYKNILRWTFIHENNVPPE